MLNDLFNVTLKDSQSSFVNWQAQNPSDVSWIFVNGQHLYGPLYFDTEARSAEIPFATSDILKIDIHDMLSDGDEVESIYLEPNTQPLIAWNHVDYAVSYKIYHREYGKAESVIYDTALFEGVQRYEVLCPKKLNGVGGVWHFFRVEAVDKYGNQSVRKSWPYYVMELPDKPQSITVSNGSSLGLFDIEIS